jgi:hypothetical protein
VHAGQQSKAKSFPFLRGTCVIFTKLLREDLNVSELRATLMSLCEDIHRLTKHGISQDVETHKFISDFILELIGLLEMRRQTVADKQVSTLISIVLNLLHAYGPA